MTHTHIGTNGMPTATKSRQMHEKGAIYFSSQLIVVVCIKQCRLIYRLSTIWVVEAQKCLK